MKTLFFEKPARRRRGKLRAHNHWYQVPKLPASQALIKPRHKLSIGRTRIGECLQWSTSRQRPYHPFFENLSPILSVRIENANKLFEFVQKQNLPFFHIFQYANQTKYIFLIKLNKFNDISIRNTYTSQNIANLVENFLQIFLKFLSKLYFSWIHLSQDSNCGITHKLKNKFNGVLHLLKQKLIIPTNSMELQKCIMFFRYFMQFFVKFLENFFNVEQY